MSLQAARAFKDQVEAGGDLLGEIRQAIDDGRAYAEAVRLGQTHGYVFTEAEAERAMLEAAELGEHFQWADTGAAAATDPEARRAISHEMADVLLYLIRLADKLDVDLVAAAREKLELNARKYPVDKARGRSTKYTDL